MTAHPSPIAPSGEIRIEEDSLGPVEVPNNRLWGAQTQRSLTNFQIGMERFRWPRSVIRAFGLIKKCAALANSQLSLLSRSKADLIVAAADEVTVGCWDDDFPLVVFQTGSGTQTNMNANEVISRRAMVLAGDRGLLDPRIHPNDDVNLGQSSNDVFPTVMHISVVEEIHQKLIPAVCSLSDTFENKAQQFGSLVMLGRTHLQDALPLTVGQLFLAWVNQLDDAISGLRQAAEKCHALPIGGTAVGTGFGTHPNFAETVIGVLNEETGFPFQVAPSKLAALAGHDALMNVSAALRTLASLLMKIANDIRWYASGPRAGLGEFLIPENEPGSSIMPGKINPTQCEALTMVAVQVYGNDHAVAFANSQGHFQLNTFKPIILHNVLESIQLLSDGCQSFNDHCAVGLEPNADRIQQHVQNSLMLATALNAHIGYKKAAEISLHAHRHGQTLREAAIQSGYVTPQQFDQWVIPEEMVGPSLSSN